MEHDGLYPIPGQRPVHGQRLRHHRVGLHHGLRYRQDAELRSRRRHYGRCLCLVLCHVVSRPSRLGIGHSVLCGLHGSRCSHRGSGLQAAAPGGPAGRSDHGHRRVLLPAERRAAPVGRHAQELYFARHLPGAGVLGQVQRERCLARHHRRLPDYHGRPGVLYGQDQDG